MSREIVAEKAVWRGRFRSARAALSPADRQRESEAVAERVLGLPDLAAAETVHLYWSRPDEVGTHAIARTLRAQGVTVALPVVVPGDTPRLVHRPFDGEDTLIPGPFGVWEPPATAPAVLPGQIDLVLVPGLAFGRDGSRLGYGGGYYDAFLSETAARRIGLAWSGALVDAVPAEPHDQLMDGVVTATATVRPSRP